MFSFLPWNILKNWRLTSPLKAFIWKMSVDSSNIYMHVYYLYTYIIELCQHVFIYNEEGQWASHTSCGQVLKLSQNHFDDNREGTLFSMITYLHIYIFTCPSCFCKMWALCVLWIYIYIYYIYIYTGFKHIYHVICVIFLNSKRRYSIGQNLIEIKHKVKWR